MLDLQVEVQVDLLEQPKFEARFFVFYLLRLAARCFLPALDGHVVKRPVTATG